MVVVGVTGGAGVGKGTVSAWFESQNVPVADTDVIARRLCETGMAGYNAILGEFGAAGLFDTAGSLDRAALGRLVFSDSSARARLERILHPMIRAQWRALVTQWSQEGQRAAVVVIPLLFETGAENEFHHVICVACGDQEQRQRLVARGWESARVDGVLSAQWSQARRMDKSSHVVWTQHASSTTGRQTAMVAKSVGIWSG